MNSNSILKQARKIFLLGFLGFLVSACSKNFLDQKPYTSVTPEDALDDASDIAIALNGAYADLRDVSLYGRTLPVFGDLYADNAFTSIKNSGKYVAFDNYTVFANNGDFSGIWNMSYNTILRVNNIINAPVDDESVRSDKGEAYALRALMYFNLVRIFARPYTESPQALGIPIVLTYDPALKPARNTVAEVYEQILADLDQAISREPVYHGSARISLYAAKALQAKVWLYMGDFEKALAVANDVINNSGFQLVAKDELLSYWADGTYHGADVKKETLFEVDADEVSNISFNELACIYNQNSAGDLLANETLYGLYSATDVRRGLFKEGAREQGEPNAVLVQKYKNYTGNFDNKKVLRFSEMYLIAAECNTRLGKDEQAKAVLSTWMAERDPAFTTAASGDELLELIIQERRKEFAFEGDRFLDLNRLQLDLHRKGGNYAVKDLVFSDYRRIAPIPKAEMDANGNMKQNPDYTE
ncbi:RagB/SusD family nutrient uptake outer membrane protein [Olivibacter ginsenosidimutans]|uniref:RagB/SusD family nutrient uptake outer membrane protein n=1 Tax=Olivibacter ginsenosidimutans TaxID=1176537 RepID=A0ABP9BGW3_9SPHI